MVEVPLFAEGSDASGGLSGGINGGLSENENTLLTLIEQNPGVNISKLKEHLNVSRRTVERWIALLRHQQKIEFRGSKKIGGYFPK